MDPIAASEVARKKVLRLPISVLVMLSKDAKNLSCFSAPALGHAPQFCYWLTNRHTNELLAFSGH